MCQLAVVVTRWLAVSSLNRYLFRTRAQTNLRATEPAAPKRISRFKIFRHAFFAYFLWINALIPKTEIHDFILNIVCIRQFEKIKITNCIFFEQLFLETVATERMSQIDFLVTCLYSRQEAGSITTMKYVFI